MAQAPTKLKNRLFSEEIWNKYVLHIEEDFQLKTYPHLDPFFDFRLHKEKIKQLVSNPDFKEFKKFNFKPFLKILQKNPRLKLQKNDNNNLSFLSIFFPKKKKYTLKSKIRPICFASHFDGYIYGFYSYALNEFYQKHIKDSGYDEVVLAYRTDLNGHCNIQFAKEAFEQVKLIAKKENGCSVIALDIKGYFDNIDHEILKEQWLKIINDKRQKLPYDQFKVYKSITEYSYINFFSYLKHFNINLKTLKKRHLKKYENKAKIPPLFNSILDLMPNSINGKSFNKKMAYLRNKNLISINSEFDKNVNNRVPKKRGIPQGSPMSAVLSNIYLSDFDKEIFDKGKQEGFVYRRYCDDLLIICPTQMVNDLKSHVMNLIKNKYNLTIQNKKTDIIDFRFQKDSTLKSYKRILNKGTENFDQLTSEIKNEKKLQYLGFEFNGEHTFIRSSSLSRYFRKMKARIEKTVKMAYSENSKSETIFKQQLYSRYSHFGKRNFISYAKRAASEYYINSKKEKKEGMNSPQIRKQIARHLKIIRLEIIKTSSQRAEKKGISRSHIKK